MLTVSQLILASTSPYRAALLKQSGLSFATAAPDVDETTIQHTLPLVLAQLRAQAKALDIAQKNPGTLVIGADQVFAMAGHSFDKAADAEEAIRRLQQFSGKSHYLHNGIALYVWSAATETLVLQHTFTTTVTLTMRTLTSEEIKAYVATSEWRGSVGCYKIEGCGINLFTEVNGSQSDIIGLPLTPLLHQFYQWGINPLLQASGPWQLVKP